MDADLDTLCTVIYCTADDLLPAPKPNARRRVTDAEVVKLCVAQAIMGVPPRPPLLGDGERAPRPSLPAAARPGRLLQASPPPRRHDRAATALPTRATSGECACTPSARPTARPGRSSWPRPRATNVRSASRCSRRGGELLICDKGYAGREFAAGVAALGATVVRPSRKDEPGRGPHLAPIRQRSESIVWTCRDPLTLERHGRAPSPACSSVSCSASSASRPASASTTDCGDPAVHWSTTAPEAVGVESIA